MRMRVRGGLEEETEAMRGNWTNKTNKIDKKSPLWKDLKLDGFGRKQRGNGDGLWGEKRRDERGSRGECKREARTSRPLQSTSAFSRSDGGYRQIQLIMRSTTVCS